MMTGIDQGKKEGMGTRYGVAPEFPAPDNGQEIDRRKEKETIFLIKEEADHAIQSATAIFALAGRNKHIAREFAINVVDPPNKGYRQQQNRSERPEQIGQQTCPALPEEKGIKC